MKMKIRVFLHIFVPVQHCNHVTHVTKCMYVIHFIRNFTQGVQICTALLFRVPFGTLLFLYRSVLLIKFVWY